MRLTAILKMIYTYVLSELPDLLKAPDFEKKGVMSGVTCRYISETRNFQTPSYHPMPTMQTIPAHGTTLPTSKCKRRQKECMQAWYARNLATHISVGVGVLCGALRLVRGVAEREYDGSLCILAHAFQNLLVEGIGLSGSTCTNNIKVTRKNTTTPSGTTLYQRLNVSF